MTPTMTEGAMFAVNALRKNAAAQNKT